MLIGHVVVAQCPNLNTQFTTNQTVFCGASSQTLSLTNTSTGSNASTSSYQWFLNGNLQSTTTGLNVPANIPLNGYGEYTIMLIGTNTASCKDTSSIQIKVVPHPTAHFTFSPDNECAQRTIHFSNNSTNTLSSFTTYHWNFGDGNTSSSKNPTHQYTAGGNYTVVLTVTNASGCSDTYSLPIHVKDIPLMAGITGDGGDGTAVNCLAPVDPQTSYSVNFSNNTTGAVGYAWDFGDGNTSTNADPTHTYNSYGTFHVVLTTTGSNGCTISDHMDVVFDKFVSASLNLDLTEYSGCAPLALTTLQNNSHNATVFVWDFGDGTPAITTTSPTPPAHAYTTGGNYTITLTASNSCNTAFSTIGPIVVVGKPNVKFNLYGNNGCAPATLSFSNATTGTSPANAYQWDMGNGNTYTNTTIPPNQTYNNVGTYTISLTASNACGDSTLTHSFTLDTIPLAAIDVLPDEGCSPLTVDVTDHSTGHITYHHWYKDGSYYSGGSSVGPFTYSYPPGNSPVTRTISLTVGNGCGSTSDAVSIIVHRPTKADFTASVTAVCLGLPITFTNQSLGENLTYEWNFDDGTTSTSVGPHTHTYTHSGTYDVTLIAKGYCGNDTAHISITIYPIPIADFSPDIMNGCEDLSVTFTNNSTPTANSSWNFGAGASPTTSSSYNPGTVVFSTPGQHEIILTVQENGCVNKDTNQITVYPVPTADFSVTPSEGCTPITSQFTNNSTNTGTETYDWNMGNGNTYTGLLPPNQTYLALDNDSIYTAYLIVMSNYGCIDSTSKFITTHPIPIADFNIVSDSICQNTSAVFVNNSTPGMSYEWNFGDGSTSTTANPSHQYPSPGNYTVELIVTSPFSCADTLTKDILVQPIPVAQFSAITVCLGYETQFTNQSTGDPTQWNWDFGNGNTASAQNPVQTYTSPGNYTVILTVTNGIGCADNYTTSVQVNAVPVADFSSSNYCLGDATTFTNLTTGTTVGMEWNFGDGSPINTTVQPTHVFPAAGDYTIQLVAFGGSGCSDTITEDITIDSIPSANFTFVSVCSGDTTFFTDQSLGNPDTYSWDFDNGATAVQPNPSVVYSASGTYNVLLTVSYSATGCTSSLSLPVVAHPHTSPQFDAPATCFKQNTVFTDQTSGNPTTWTWNFKDGSPLNTQQNPTHLFPSAGSYNVELVTQNNFGCTDSVSHTITIHPLPVPGFSYDTVCLNVTTHFTATSSNAVAWKYDFGDGLLAQEADPTHIYATAGSYIVKQIVTNSFGCTDTIEHTVIVRPNPTAQFTLDTACFSFPTNFINQSTGFTSSSWNFGDLGNTSPATSPYYIYSQSGVFVPQLIVKNSYGCSDTVTKNALVQVQPEAGFTNTTVCARDVVSFTDTSTGNPTDFHWNFGDGSGTFTQQNISHVFTSGGLYSVSLIVKNGSGCADTITKSIEVYTVPIPDFEVDTACLYTVSHFTDLSSDSAPIVGWDWNFGDGNTSPDQNPTYIYQNSGNYIVSLTVTNSHGCDSTYTDQAKVLLTPDADFSFTVDCFGAPTTFTDLSTNNPGIYHWDFGDGATSNTGPNEQHTYTSPGSYVVQLKVADNNAVCGDSIAKIVTISNAAQADFLIPSQVCVNDLFHFYDNSSASIGTIIDYQWRMGDSTTYSTEDGTHTYSAPGVYQIKLNITTSDGCQAYHTESIDVLPSTTANFDWKNTCLNTPTQFTNLSAGGTTSWYWDFGDGTSDQTQFPVHTFPQAGNYTISLIVQNLPGCADTIKKTVTIDAPPLVDFNSDTVCYGDLTTFTNQSNINTGTIDSYQWIFENGEDSSALENPQYAFITYTQSHSVTLIATSDKGCIDTLTKTVSLLPIVHFDLQMGDLFGCAPVTVTFTNQSSINGAAILNYMWDFGDGDSSFQKSPTHTFLNAGDYPIHLVVNTSTDCKITNQDSILLTVFPSPTAGFFSSPTVTTISTPIVKVNDNSLGTTQWEYDVSDGYYSNSPNFSHKFNDTGVYYITQYVQNDYGCIDTAKQAIRIKDDLILYIPNAFTPDNTNGVNDNFTWSVIGAKQFELFVFNRWGEIVFSSKDINGHWDGTYHGKQVPDGVYIWKVNVTANNDEQRTMTGHVSVLR